MQARDVLQDRIRKKNRHTLEISEFAMSSLYRLEVG
jgi:hypothetical protein